MAEINRVDVEDDQFAYRYDTLVCGITGIMTTEIITERL